jgi:hypothetical protein
MEQISVCGGGRSYSEQNLQIIRCDFLASIHPGKGVNISRDANPVTASSVRPVSLFARAPPVELRKLR